MRLLLFGIGIAALVFLVSSGHFFFLPLLILPFGLFGGRRRNRRF